MDDRTWRLPRIGRGGCAMCPTLAEGVSSAAVNAGAVLRGSGAFARHSTVRLAAVMLCR
jgi:hypothetical protein